MTLLMLFHQSHDRDFKAFYTEHVRPHLRVEFPGLVSYTRFSEFMPETLILLCAYLRHCCGTCTGISFLDSTALAVCHHRRLHASCVARLHRAALCKSATQAMHKVFAGLAARGKSSLGWFFGFKRPLVFNDQGELLNLALTPSNVDNRKPVPKLVRRLFGKLFADKGYISRPLFEQLLNLWHSAHHQVALQHAQPTNAIGGPTALTQARHCRKHHCPVWHAASLRAAPRRGATQD